MRREVVDVGATSGAAIDHQSIPAEEDNPFHALPCRKGRDELTNRWQAGSVHGVAKHNGRGEKGGGGMISCVA